MQYEKENSATIDPVSHKKALEVRNLTRKFGGLLAVNGMSFDLVENEVLGLIGPNGSGKTTMINLISGAIKATDGNILLFNQNITKTSPTNIARLGIARTFQIVRILPTLSVLENVAAGGVFGYDRRWGASLEEHSRHMLSRVGLENAEHAPVDSLTYIDQKRLELARALVSDPRILLLDEWLAGLNPTELLTGIDLIKELRSDGRTIIVVEHVIDAIRSLCDRCVVMNSGVKIAEGIPSDVLKDEGVIAAYLGEEDA